MSKIVCEICGTTYQDNTSACPVCGWTHNVPAADEETELDYLPEEQEEDFVPEFVSQRSAKASGEKAAKIFDYDAVNTNRVAQTEVITEDEYDDNDNDSGEYEEERPRTNIFLVILLVLLIVGLLVVTGYLFFRFFLPGRNVDEGKETVPPATAEIVETLPTEAPEIPCTNLALPDRIGPLTTEGQYSLLHVVVLPDNTTDPVTYKSENEAVAIVSDEGRVTAVGEGETNVIITCGNQSITCPVVVKYEPETEPTEETTAPTEETTAESQPEETKPAVTLKLKKDDIQFGRMGVYTTLELDCELSPTDVKWESNNKYVADVDAEGRVTALGTGIANITVTYGNQQVVCIVRCRW